MIKVICDACGGDAEQTEMVELSEFANEDKEVKIDLEISYSSYEVKGTVPISNPALCWDCLASLIKDGLNRKMKK